MTALTNRNVRKITTQIDELSEEIRDIMAEGFYPEEYHKFSRRIEDKLSEIETLTGMLEALKDPIND